MLEVRRLRKNRGWNQTELAVHASLAPSVISQVENGKRSPSARTLNKLARALEVDVADLFPKGQAPLPLEEDQGQRGDPFLNAWTSYMLSLAREWEEALPEHDELRAKPQLAYEFLSKNESVQAECYTLLETIGRVIKGTPHAEPSEADTTMWLKEGTSIKELTIRRYADRADLKELVEALLRMDDAAELWDGRARTARDATQNATEFRPDLERVDKGVERAAEERRSAASLAEEFRSVA